MRNNKTLKKYTNKPSKENNSVLLNRRKKLAIFEWKMPKPIVPQPGTYTIGCPYCGGMCTAEGSGKLQEAVCPNVKCNKNWHQGVFQVLPAIVRSKERRGMGKNQPALWNIRIAHANGEDLLSFKTFASLQLRQKDVLTLSYRKKSKGVFRKEWTGEWDPNIKLLTNHTINASWKL